MITVLWGSRNLCAILYSTWGAYDLPFLLGSSVVTLLDQIHAYLLGAYLLKTRRPNDWLSLAHLSQGKRQIIRNLEHMSLKPMLTCYLLCRKFLIINHEIFAIFCLFANEFWFDFRAFGSANAIWFENYSRTVLMLSRDCFANPCEFLLSEFNHFRAAFD